VNQRTLKLAGGVAIALALAFGVGWVLGASGRAELRDQLRASELRAHISEIRARLYASRVELTSLNFGAAAQDLEATKASLTALSALYERDGDTDRVTRLQKVREAAEQGRRLAAQVNQAAQSDVQRALNAFDEAVRGGK